MRFLPAVVILGAGAAGYVHEHGGSTESLTKALTTSWITTEEGDPAAPSVKRNSGARDPLTGQPAGDTPFASASQEMFEAENQPAENAFAAIFRFDLTPEAIMERWGQVSPALGDANYEGCRVPLVTGTAATDIAGSLSYYFDRQTQLRRIAFVGTSGDASRFVEFITGQFGFQRQRTQNPRQIVYTGASRFRGTLHILPAKAQRGDQLSTNYHVKLVLEQ